MRKTYKYRLYPNKTTEQKLFWTLTRCRELYNAGATSTYPLTLPEAMNIPFIGRVQVLPQEPDGYGRSCQWKQLAVKELPKQRRQKRKAISA